MRKLLVYCDFCKQQHFTDDIVPVKIDGVDSDLCSVDCFLKRMARIYHQAAADDLPIQINTGMKLEVRKS